MNKTKELLYYCPVSVGGIARNAHEQCKAFCDQGIDVTMLCPENWTYPTSNQGYKQLKILLSPPDVNQRGTWKSRLMTAIGILQNARTLAITINAQQYSRVLFASYSEYLAPLWSWLLKQCQRQGVVFGVMVLDPVRDYVVGPLWWHRWSIAEGYSFVREAFVHKEICLDTVKPMPCLRTTVVPHGPYLFPTPTKNRTNVRSGLQIPENAPLCLSFGHLRDNKNLDLLLQALVDYPDVYLLVAGTEASPNQKTSQVYQSIAKFHGVSERVRWLINYIADEDVANLFNAADYAVMCYSDSFRSTSGILYIAAPLKIPILVSCGDAPLGSLVEQYQIGHRISPYSVKAISDGIGFLISNNFEGGRWEDFLSEQSYQENTRIILEKLWSPE